MDFTPPNYTYNFDFDRAYDGDTVFGWIDLGMKTKVYRSIRFLGIDTEEIRNRDASRKVKAIAARDRVIELCENATKIYVTTKKDKGGKYGRLLGYIWCEDADGNVVNVNEVLVQEGFEKAPK